MAFRTSVSATPSATRSVISGSSCRRTRCSMRSPTWRQHLRQPLRPPPPLADQPRRQRSRACRCSPTRSSSNRHLRRIRSPCSLRLHRRHRHPQHQRRCRCLAQAWPPLHKASLPQPLHWSQLLVLRHLPQHPRSLPFLRHRHRLNLLQHLARLRLREVRHRLLFLLPQRLPKWCQRLVRLRLLLPRQRSFPSRLKQRLQPLFRPLALPRPPALRRSSALLHPHLPKLQRRLRLLRSSPLHSRRHPHLCNRSRVHSHPSEHLRSSSSLRSANLPHSRVPLSQEAPSLSIPLLPHRRDLWWAKHRWNQASAAPSCSGRSPRRSSSLPQLSHLPRKANPPPACLPHRLLLRSRLRLPSLLPWKRFPLSPRPSRRSHRPRADCSALPASLCFRIQRLRRPDPSRSQR